MLPRRHLHHSLRLLLSTCLLMGCSATETPPEPQVPHVVAWAGPATVILKEWTELLGTVQPLPDKVARVSAPFEGQVVAVLPPDSDRKEVKEGELVKKDTVLVQLNSQVAKNNSDKAKALREAAEQDEKQARAALGLAKDKYDSIKDVSTIPKLQKEEARILAENAQSQLIAAEKRLLAAKQDEATATEQLSYTSLKTPIAGRLDRILVAPGQTIPAGTVVAEVSDVDKEVDVLCFVPGSVVPQLMKSLEIDEAQREVRIGAVEPGNIAIKPAGPRGRIVFISERADPDTGNFAVKVRFPNAGPATAKLRPNTALRIRVLSARKDDALTIPDSALLEDTDPPTVVVVESEVKKDGGKPVKDDKGNEVIIYKARRLQATIGIRDSVKGQVELLALSDKEKNWKGEMATALFVTMKNQGLQTDDLLKQEEEEPEAPPK
jgi:RND family efflux transporter MFP subunit